MTFYVTKTLISTKITASYIPLSAFCHFNTQLLLFTNSPLRPSLEWDGFLDYYLDTLLTVVKIKIFR